MQKLFAKILKLMNKLIAKNDKNNKIDDEEYQRGNVQHLNIDLEVFRNYEDEELADFISYYNLAPAENRTERILTINEFLMSENSTLQAMMKKKMIEEKEFAKQLDKEGPKHGSLTEYILLRRQAKEKGMSMLELLEIQQQERNDDEEEIFDEMQDNQLDQEVDKLFQGVEM